MFLHSFIRSGSAVQHISGKRCCKSMPVRTAYREFLSSADTGGSAKVCDMAQVHKIAVVDTDKIFRRGRGSL